MDPTQFSHAGLIIPAWFFIWLSNALSLPSDVSLPPYLLSALL